MTPGSAARTVGRSSLGAATAKGDAGAGVFDDYAALPLPADDEEEFVPMPEDDDGGGGAAPIPYDDDLFDAPAGGTQPLGDSPRPRAATPGVSGRGMPSDDDDDDLEDAAADAEGAAPRRGGRERGAAPASFGFGPATQAAEKEAAGTKAGGIRKRKFRVDDVIALTNAHIRAALADASDLLRPAKAQRVGAAAARAAASVDDLLAAPACLSGGACDALRGLFARAPGAAASTARALRAAAASPAAAAAAATRGAAAALADVDAAPIAEEDDFGGAAGGWDDDDGDAGGAGMGASAPAPEDWAAAAPPPSAGRRGSAGGAARLAAALEEEGDDDARSDSEDAGGAYDVADGEAGGDDAAGPADPAAWSKRTRNVLHVLQRSFAAASAAAQPAPARRGSGAAAAAAAAASAEPVLALAPMLEGETKGHAARMFFELLVLHTKGYVALQQPAPYGDISIAQTPKLVAAGL